MSDDRNRISVTLSDIELEEVKAIADVLGIKPTRVVYECIKSGLNDVLAAGQRKQNNIRLAQSLKSQIDWVAEKEQEKPKEKTFNQRKHEAKRNKK